MMPERTNTSTPPSMEELVRRSTIENGASGTRKPSLMHSDTAASHTSATQTPTARFSISTDIDNLTRSDTGRLSVSTLARSMTKVIPDVRMHRPHVGKVAERTTEQNLEETEELSSVQGGKKSRRLSYQSLSGSKMITSPELPQKPPLVIEEAPVCEFHAKPGSQDKSPKCGGLAERRKVKMDLTLPTRLPDLSDQTHSPPGHLMSSITPSRPRSPKTPWTRDKELNWSRRAKQKAVKTAPIIEGEDEAYIGMMAQITLDDTALESNQEPALQPLSIPLLTTPEFVRPPQKIRDRCYVSRPTVRRDKSGGLSTSESDFGSTPDGHWTPEVTEGNTEPQMRTQDELGELAKTEKSSRSRRWPWNKSKASGSDEQTPDERKDTRMSVPVNFFKRSNRPLEGQGIDKKEKKSSKGINPPWRWRHSMDKPPLPSASLANMAVPPIFVPPGCEKVPTPPMFDSGGEVRGKLADFFFESGGFKSAKRRSKAGADGYWDSNAVLMSMQPEINLTNDEDDEEGPEGRPPTAFHFGPMTDTPGIMTSPGLITSPDGYLTVKSFGSGSIPPTPGTPGTPGTAQDSWFRMHYSDPTPDGEFLTAAALKEADERRKFEWLIPEHLPNSPLCPLHPKYVGPSKGLCYWHGRKSNGWGVELGRDYISHPVRVGGGNSPGWATGKTESLGGEKRRMRRLNSLSIS